MSDASQEDALPPHEVFELIGQGLYGDVYRAWDAVQTRAVALKVIHTDNWPPEAPDQFLREAQAVARIQHPHLLPVLAVGKRDGRPCYTMPLALNGDLSRRRGQFTDPRAAADLAAKLARATAAAHAHGMLHGDLRPMEVLFDENEQPRIGGFGLSPFLFFALGAGGGFDRGRRGYCAPEHLAAEGGAIEVSTDVWALGVILYELLTGQHPFAGQTAMEILFHIVSCDLTPPRRIRLDLDRELEAVVLHSLEPRPADRYPSARALAEDLERWLRAERTYARPKTLTQRILSRLSWTLRRKAP